MKASRFVNGPRILSAMLCVLLLSSQASARKVEGEVGLDTSMAIGHSMKSGKYSLMVNFRSVDLKYVFYTLLGEPVEIFSPRYEISEISAKNPKTGMIDFTISVVPTGDDITSVSGTWITVSQDVMNKVVMSSLHFRLKFCTSEGRVDFQRRNPGVLFGGDDWGFDVAGSPSWSRFVDVTSDLGEFDNFRSASAAKAAYGWLALEGVTNCGSQFLDASFDLGPLFAHILAVQPDAFKFQSEADSLMLSLIGQYEQAEQRDDEDLDRRHKLTIKALTLTSDDVMPETVALWVRARYPDRQDHFELLLDDLGEAAEILEEIDSKKDQSKDFTHRMNRRLKNLDLRYDARELRFRGLSSEFIEKLDALRARIARIGKLVRFSKNGRYGYRRELDGKEIISASYLEALSFSDGFAIVRDSNGWQVLNEVGKVVIGPTAEKIMRKGERFVTESFLERTCEVDKMQKASFQEIHKYGRLQISKKVTKFDRPLEVTCKQEQQQRARQEKERVAQVARDEQDARDRTAREARDREDLKRRAKDWVNDWKKTPKIGSCTKPKVPSRPKSLDWSLRLMDRVADYVDCKFSRMERLANYCEDWRDEEKYKSRAFREAAGSYMDKAYNQNCVEKMRTAASAVKSIRSKWKKYKRRFDGGRLGPSGGTPTLTPGIPPVYVPLSSGGSSGSGGTRSGSMPKSYCFGGPADLEDAPTRQGRLDAYNERISACVEKNGGTWDPVSDNDPERSAAPGQDR